MTSYFQSGLLPSGHATEEGLSLELRQVQRDDGGVYVCTANNGVGPTAKANIEVEIKCKFDCFVSTLIYLNRPFKEEIQPQTTLITV